MTKRQQAAAGSASAAAAALAAWLLLGHSGGPLPQLAYPGVARPASLTNQLLVKIRPSARSTVRTGGLANASTGLRSLTAVNRVRGVAAVDRVVAPRPGAPASPVFDWYVVTLGPTPAAGVSARATRERRAADRPTLGRALALLRTDASVAAVEEISSVSTDTINDPYYASSGAWGQPFQDLWPLVAIRAEAAWATSTGAGITVAVIDTGVDVTHPDLAANIWQNPKEICGDGIDNDGNGFVDDCAGWDFVNRRNAAVDDFGHGTHVAGTIAAVANNALGISGVAPGARIMAVKALDANGGGDIDVLAQAIVYAADNGARVINASWGGLAANPQVLSDAIAYAHDVKGSVFIAAAGNNNVDVAGFFPANDHNAVAVAAVDHLDGKSYFSNFGPGLDVAAPGGGDADPTGKIDQPIRSILSLLSKDAVPLMTGSGSLVVGGQYLRQAGTSMAAPHASGVAALVLALHPTYKPEQVRQVLRMTAADIQAPGFDPGAGYGRLDAGAAVAAPVPLVARIASPTVEQVLQGPAMVTITGEVSGSSGAAVAGWLVEYGAGAAPTSWVAIATGTAPVTGTLATWATASAADGPYVIRLTARSATGAVWRDQAQVTVDNFYVTAPLTTVPYFAPGQRYFSPYRGGDVVHVTGTVALAGLSGYTMAVRNLDTGADAGSAGITLANGGLQKVVAGELASWDTAAVPAGHYTLTLTATASGAAFTESTSVTVDPTLHAVLRQRVPPYWTTSPTWVFAESIDHLSAVDLGTGASALLINDGHGVDLVDASGRSLPGWPRATSDTIPMRGAVAGDLDGDGRPEIVAWSDPNQLWAWHLDGTPVAGFPRATMNSCDHLVVDDLTGDGKAEIVCSNWTGPVLSIIGPAATVDVALPTRGDLVAVGDVDGDGQKELVLRSRVDTARTPITVMVVSAAGKLKAQFTIPYDTTPIYEILSDPALGDVDGDGVLDIVIGDCDGRVHALRGRDGSELPGWPVRIPARTDGVKTMYPPVPVALSPIVADLDGDGRAEVIVPMAAEIVTEPAPAPRTYEDLYVLSGDGTVRKGWPQTVLFTGGVNNQNGGVFRPVAADVDGDGQADIVLSLDTLTTLPTALWAYHADGTVVRGFPKVTAYDERSRYNAPAVADLDGDGRLNLAWLDFHGNVYVWDLPSPVTAPRPWPMFGRDAGHTSRGPLGLPVPVPLPPVVAFTAPAGGATLSGTATVSLSVAERGSPVTGVSLLLDGTALAALAPPYAYAWDTTGAANGAHTLTATAASAAGPGGASLGVTVANAAPPRPGVTDTVPPTVALLYPVPGQSVSGAVAVAVTAADNAGIQRVDLLLDGVLVSSVTAVPVTVTWDTSAALAGPHTLTARAYDLAGNAATATVTVRVVK